MTFTCINDDAEFISVETRENLMNGVQIMWNKCNEYIRTIEGGLFSWSISGKRIFYAK